MEQKLKEGCYGRFFPADKMYVYLRGKLSSSGMEESSKALTYMRDKHRDVFRTNGQPYEVHPLWMACYASSFNDPNITDTTIATILLHDVCEDTGTRVDELPFSDVVRTGVECMTATRFKNETSYEMKKRYMNGLLKSKDATIAKGIDRYANLMTMTGTFFVDKIRKNVVETDQLLLPVLKDAKYVWPEAMGLLYIIRHNVRSVNDNLALSYGVKLTDPDFVNAPDAKDYSYLLTGATSGQ